MGAIYDQVKNFKRKYPGTVAWRLKKHCEVAERYLNPGEEVRYAFPAQKNQGPLEFFDTYVLVLTNKRILLARKRLIVGSYVITIVPDLFNDLEVAEKIVWGRVTIDTLDEDVILSNISKKALPEIETNITQFMMEITKGMKKERVASLKGSTHLTKNGYRSYDDVQ